MATPTCVSVDRAKLLEMVAGYARNVACYQCMLRTSCEAACEVDADPIDETITKCRAALCAAFGLEVTK